MGTRADFYVGRGKRAKWIGSRPWDGYPSGIARDVKRAKTAKDFRAAVKRMSKEITGWTDPKQGWPWPWDDSSTTDYAYAFDGGRVWASCFGGPWFKPEGKCPEDEEPAAEFPDMRSVKNVARGDRSGLLIISR